MSNGTENCEGCKNFKRYKKTKNGKCRRYPVQTPTDADSWCAEFKKV